jgi:hypothetical protein
MAILAKDTGGKDFKKVPPGAHFAICNMVVDCGLQEGFGGKPQHKVYLRWEVPDERVSYEKDGRQVEGPCALGSMYTLSLSEKATLRKTLENWRGKAFTADELKGFDIAQVLGKCCQIMVTHSEDGKYANVTGVMGISRDQKARSVDAKPENKPVAFSLDEYDERTFQTLPNWLKEKIENRLAAPTEPPPSSGNTGRDDDLDDDIPFRQEAA